MRIVSLTRKTGAKLAAIVVLLTPLALAQMGGGMMGGGGMGSGGMGGGNSQTGYGMQPGGVYGMGYGMMGGSAFGMGSGMIDTFSPAVAADGTAYVMRWLSGTSQSATQPQAQTQLVAISPLDGTVKWALPITGTVMSQPVVGTDGRIFLTSSFYNTSGSGTTGATGHSALFVITPAGTSAAISNPILLTGAMASVPKIASDGSGGYIVYIIASDADGMGYQTTSTGGAAYLYAFLPSGATKFPPVKLSQ